MMTLLDAEYDLNKLQIGEKISHTDSVGNVRVIERVCNPWSTGLRFTVTVNGLQMRASPYDTLHCLSEAVATYRVYMN